MAAITPHIGEEEPMDPTVAQFHDCVSGKGRLTGLGAAYGCPTPGDVVQILHAGLSQLQFNRAALQEQLNRRTITLEWSDMVRKSTTNKAGVVSLIPSGGFRLLLDKPVEGLEWSQIGGGSGYKGASVLSWTSKMQTPSFSLPAGAAAMGGACPGAQAGMSVVREGPRAEAEKRVLYVLNHYAGRGAETIERVNLPAAVCQHCYATGGNYAYANQIMNGMVRFAWTQHAVQQGFFADVMIEALKRADYLDEYAPVHWAETGWRFFRIHDSGDFYNKAYFEAWKKIADAFAPGNPDGNMPIMFWAPTRMWAVEGWLTFVNKVNGGDNNRGNFIIRASAYELNQHAPELREPGSGWGPASVVTSPGVADQIAACEIESTYDWDCRAYAVQKGPNCRDAESPLGGPGCRACWLSDGIVNYRAH